jgi:hypothetical protein
MSWTVNTLERFGGVHRAPRINPYLPARTERLGATTDNPKFSLKDIGKPVKLSGDTCVLCADTNEIYGFIESVSVGTDSGYAIGGVLSDPGLEFLAVDEVGDLAVGDLVVAGTPAAIGTALPAKGANVKKRTGATTAGQSAIFSTGGLAIKAGGEVLVKTVNTVPAMVGGTLVSLPAADMPALSGTVVADKFNVFAFFVNAAGVTSTVMGTAGDTLAAVVVPSANATRAMLGYVVINPTGTGNFVGGETALDDATVVPNAVYVNTVGAVAQADQIVGQHLWQVLARYGANEAGRQVMVRKI